MNKCRVCSNICEQSWMILKNESIILDTEDAKAPQMIHYCCYMCHVSDRSNLPKTVWHLVQNKEDFNKDPRPITISQKKNFQYLTYSEIKNLNFDERKKYYQQKQNQMDWEKSKIYDEMYLEDEYTEQIENNNYYNSDDDY